MKKKSVSLSRSLARESRQLGMMTIPAVAWYGLFCYLPLFGIFFAFKDFTPKPGQSLLTNLFVNSPWVGFRNFSYLFRNPQSVAILLNTLSYNVVFLVVGIVIPVLLAIILAEVRQKLFSGLVQMTLVLPYFLSWVIVSYCVYGFLSTDHGQINAVLNALGMASVQWYYTNAIGSGMFFRSDDGKYVEKLLPYERFKVCKTPSGTRRTLNKIFEHCEADPTPDNRFKDLCFTPLYSTLLKSKK